MTIQTINPFTETILNNYTEMSDETIEAVINNVHAAYQDWRFTDFKERSQKMLQAATVLRKNKERYAKLMAEEMGKPITAGLLEIEKCAWGCEYYAKNAESLLKPHIIQTEMKKSFVTYQPTGVIFAIMPWNFPMWQVFRFAAPNLMAGQGCLLKHAVISTGTALEIEKIFEEAGFPHHIFRTLLIPSNKAYQVITHPKVTGVTLTGSEHAGSAVASEAGKVLKKVVLELGGSDPYLVLHDADLEKAAQICVASRLNNSGQVCIAAKRIIVVDTIYDQFESLVLEKIKSYQCGNPLDSTTQLGPLARKDLRDTVHQQVQDSIQKGAQLKTGGYIPEEKGFFYPPTLLTEVKPGMPAFDDEIFGPVIALIRTPNESNAIELANQTRFGLGGAIFSKDIKRAEKIAAEQIEAGNVAINTLVKSDPRLPFGGIKHSGFGRELGIEGIHAFMNIKTVMIA